MNQALNEAVTKFKWSEDKETLKIIFLVGDAPPHMDYTDDVKYPDTCKLAAEKGIFINTVQCGAATPTRPRCGRKSRQGERVVRPDRPGRGPGPRRDPVRQAARRRSTPSWRTAHWCMATGEAGEGPEVPGGGRGRGQGRDRRSRRPRGTRKRRSWSRPRRLRKPRPGHLPAAPATGAGFGGGGPGAPAGGFGGDGAGFVAADRAAFNAMRGIINSYDLISDIKTGKVKLDDSRTRTCPRSCGSSRRKSGRRTSTRSRRSATSSAKRPATSPRSGTSSPRRNSKRKGRR